MMKKILLPLIGVFLLALAPKASHAQCEATVNKCSEYLTDNYISDGQVYRALIYDDQVAEFRTTLYGGAQYRIAALAGTTAGNIIFSVYDT